MHFILVVYKALMVLERVVSFLQNIYCKSSIYVFVRYICIWLVSCGGTYELNCRGEGGLAQVAYKAQGWGRGSQLWGHYDWHSNINPTKLSLFQYLHTKWEDEILSPSFFYKVFCWSIHKIYTTIFTWSYIHLS